VSDTAVDSLVPQRAKWKTVISRAGPENGSLGGKLIAPLQNSAIPMARQLALTIVTLLSPGRNGDADGSYANQQGQRV
jgi:hypothetical protein